MALPGRTPGVIIVQAEKCWAQYCWKGWYGRADATTGVGLCDHCYVEIFGSEQEPLPHE